MSKAMRAFVVVLTWSGVGFGSLQADAALGAYAAVPTAIAVAVTGAVLGLLGGVLAALAAGALGLVAAVGSGAGLEAYRAAVADGALLAPAALLAVGIAAGAWRRLLRQLRVHRAASDRAQFDVLTGLLNRDTFERKLAAWTQDAGTATPPTFAVLFVDLDRFKFVNDTFGHATGDRLLVAIADVLRENVRDQDLVARLGGDEFVVALGGVKDAAAAGVVAGKLCKRLASPFEIDGKSLNVSASVGIALFPRDGHDVATLTKSADTAMYAVKTGGKNSFTFTDHALRDRQARRLDLERQLRFALHDQELEVVYQPQYELASGRLVGFEALMRWDNRELGAVSPSEFIPIAEEAGMIVPLGHWLMREACHQARQWSAFGLPGLSMAINVSTLQFRQPGFLRQVDEAIRDARVAPESIELEVTESVLIDEFELAVATLRRLDRMGVRTALDDFGTGYSSLAYLQRLPIRSLKIDRSFVSGLVLGPTGVAGSVVPIVDAITAMGRTLGKTVVAEGVETEAQARYLQRIGVHRVQGYFYAKPLSVAQAERLLRREAAAPSRPEPLAPVAGDPRASGTWTATEPRARTAAPEAVLLLTD
jgi:diguanylate cyclase (GGDEF)-like protein